MYDHDPPSVSECPDGHSARQTQLKLFFAAFYCPPQCGYYYIKGDYRRYGGKTERHQQHGAHGDEQVSQLVSVPTEVFEFQGEHPYGAYEQQRRHYGQHHNSPTAHLQRTAECQHSEREA